MERSQDLQPIHPGVYGLLKVLVWPLFESTDQASMRNLTMKTLFLVVQATAKRVADLQACSFLVAVQGKDLIVMSCKICG